LDGIQMSNAGADGTGDRDQPQIFEFEVVPADGVRLPFFLKRGLRNVAVFFWQHLVKEISLTVRQPTTLVPQHPAN
jgi:hypothetical protein